MPNEDDDNFFDQLGFVDPDIAKKQIEEQRISHERLDYLIHRLFSQIEEGRELLEVWTKTLIMLPTAEPGMDLLQIGINEGIKSFIRNLQLTVRKVDKDE